MAISSAIITSLSTLLQTIGSTPGALNLLGNQFTATEEAQALDLIDQMEINPAMAPTLLQQLTGLKNLPLTVTNWVDQALSDPANFKNDMAQAKNSLISAVASPSALTSLFGNL